ncbi:MAG: ATP-binding protein [Chloroflexi bacterium]|nr:ATP-binding protein [Chloroflexota bacterium]MBP8058910.1 ATP-binding protein [Chloroflexota bacterium]
MITPMEIIATLIIPARLEQLAQVRHFIDNAAATLLCDGEMIDDLVLATDEAVTNIIVHGYQEQDGDIEVALCQQPGACVIILRDNAPAFDPHDAPSPDITKPLDMRPLGGLGVHLIRHLIDEMHYQHRNDGFNELILIKRMKPAANPH